MLAYRIEITPDDNGTFMVTCPQLPIVATFGETEEDARRHAVDAIETALDIMMEDFMAIPKPDGREGTTVVVSADMAKEVERYWILRALK